MWSHTGSFLIVIFCTTLRAAIIQKKIEEIVQLKCPTNVNNSNVFFQLPESMDSFQSCVISKTAPRNQNVSVVDDPNAVCILFSDSNYYDCLVTLVDKIEKCLTAEEAYLSEFILSTFNASVIDYCEVKIFTRVNEVMYILENDECVKHEIKSILHACASDLKIVNNFEKNDYVIRKTDLCSDFASMSKCVIDYLQKQCNEDYTKVVRRFFQPPLEWCNKNA